MDRRKIGGILDGVGLALLAVQFMLRLFVSGDGETGLQFFFSGLVWAGAACYFVGRALAGDRTLRLSGLEIPLLLFSILCILSVKTASYKLPALMIAVSWVSNALLFVVLSDWMGRRGVARAWTVLASTAFVVILYAVTQSAVFYPNLEARVDAGQGLEEIDPHMRLEVEARLRAREPNGTFSVSNTFAGFMAVMLPMMLGAMMDARRHGAAYWMSPDAVVRGMFLLAGATALAMTRSKGGWVAAGAGLAAFVALSLCRRRGVAKRKIAAAALVLAVAGYVAFVPFGLVDKLRPIPSMQFRLDAYWKAAVEMTKESPWQGKGLGGYSDHYARLKGDLQQESRHAHNDYLELAAEIGVPGAAAFVLIWAAALWRGMGRGKDDEARIESAPAPPWEVAAMALAALAAMAGAYGISRVFGDMGGEPYLIGLLIVAWAAFAMSTHRAHEARDGDGGSGLAIGAMAGLVAYLVHALVDFDWYAFGFSETLVVVAAVAVAAGARPLTVSLPAWVSGGFGGLLLAFAGYILMVLTPNLVTADGNRMMAKEALSRARGARESAVKNLAFAEAEARIDEAEARSPLDAEIPLMKATIFFEHWSWDASTALPAAGDMLDDKASTAREAVRRAIALRPDDGGAYFLDGYMCFALAEYNGNLGVTGENVTNQQRAAMAVSFFGIANRQFGEALKRYPTSPRYNFWYARSIHSLGNNPDKEAHYYAEAERLNGLVVNLPRLKLSDEDVLEIHARLDELEKRRKP